MAKFRLGGYAYRRTQHMVCAVEIDFFMSMFMIELGFSMISIYYDNDGSLRTLTAWPICTSMVQGGHHSFQLTHYQVDRLF